MLMLIGGLALFFAVHLVPTLPKLRLRFVGSIGASAYSGVFSLVSLLALVLMVWGYGRMQGLGRGNPELWMPASWAKHAAVLLMVPAMILLVAAYVPSRLRRVVRHPMLISVMLWALAHLLANGDLASVLLFGSFLAYGIYDWISVSQRLALGPLGKAQGGLIGDVAALAGGLALYALMLLWGHQKLTGIPLWP
jgi:uncharacterized membrane protein